MNRNESEGAAAARAIHKSENEIHPLILGVGRRLFADEGAFAALQLVNAQTTTTGVVILTYQPAEPIVGKTAID